MNKNNKCISCYKTVYQNEKAQCDQVCHETCFKCMFSGCSKKLNLRTYGSISGKIYCPEHFKAISYEGKTEKIEEKKEEEKEKKKTWIEDLEKISDFYERQIITKEEFDKFKKKILEGF
jgi:hypothetical protein